MLFPIATLLRALAACLVAILLVTGGAPAPRALAQTQPGANPDTEFPRLYQDFMQAKDTEARISLGEAALRLEPGVKTWTLQQQRPQVKWALQINLGNAYMARRQGNRADNMEQAVAALEAAVALPPRGTQAWADAQNRLAVAYQNRIRGDRADNLEKSIAGNEAALTVYTRENAAKIWAGIQTDHAITYQSRIRGDRADNLEKALAACEAALTVRTKEAAPREWAATRNSLAITYALRIRGDVADNVEKSIAGFEDALTVYGSATDPDAWASVSNNLALAYVRRVRGDRADNIEKAIAGFEATLAITTRDKYPRQWAQTRQNLGEAYVVRIRGSRAENIEKSISAYQDALTIRTKEAAPLDWSAATGGLAVAYAARIQGDRADNLEKAIALLHDALTITTQKSDPGNWARGQNNLGEAYRNRIKGSRADNLERAIAALEAALTVHTREALPVDWAMAQQNLAITYRARLRGDPADNLEKAIAANQAVLTIFTREKFPEEWAKTQSNLAVAYSYRTRGNREDNLDQSIAANQAALTVRTRESHPIDWATTQNNLAIVYSSRFRGSRQDNIEKAIAAYEASLGVRTREVDAKRWSETQGNLAQTYNLRTLGARSENLKKVIAIYEASLAVSTPEAFPFEHLRQARGLATALLETKDWQKATAVYASARRAFLTLFGEGLEEAEVRGLLSAAGPMFAEAAYAAIESGDPRLGLQLASEGKARLLAVSLKLQTLGATAEQRRRVEELRAAIRAQSRAYDETAGEARAAALDRIAALRRDLIGMAQAAGTQEGDSSLQGLSHLVPAGGAIVVPIVTRIGGKLLILASEGNPVISVVNLPFLTTAELIRLVNGDGSRTGARGGWLGAFNIQNLPPEEKRERIEEWTGAIEGVGPNLWRLFAGRLDATLAERGVRPGARVIWLPTGALGLLPLGLAREPTGEALLLEKYELVSVPSLEALAQALRQTAQATTPSLAAAINPTGEDPGLTLPFTEIEGAIVASHFPGQAVAILDKTTATPQATLAALAGKSYWHFSTHGAFDWQDARHSGLMMRNGDVLTVGALLDAEGRVARPRLVVLSACETGLYDASRNPDEFVGLPATFMQLGAAGVLGTLWQVDDLATSLLMAKFYDLHLGQGLSPPAALRGAQTWLRTASAPDLIAYANAAAARAKLGPDKLAQLDASLQPHRRSVSGRFAATWDKLQKRSGGGSAGAQQSQSSSAAADANARPFSHPYYWGGFIFSGL